MANIGNTPYVALSDLKAYLNIADSDDTQDTFLANAAQYVQGFIDRYTGRTFGWGDAGDNQYIDYSNSDNIGIVTSSLVGSLLTLNTMGPVPWVVGQLVSVFNTGTNAYNGVWAVTTVVAPTTIVVDIGASKGTLSPSNQAQYTNMPAPNFAGYVGNYVQNYRYISQDSYDGFAGKTLYLRNMDIRSIDTLYIGARNVAQPTLLDHTQYVWRDDGRLILGGSFFNTVNSSLYDSSNDSSFYGTVASGYQTITISYWIGYIGVPFEIQQAALDMCAALYVFRKSLGVQEEKIGDYQVRYDMTLRKQMATQPDTLNSLNIFKRIHV